MGLEWWVSKQMDHIQRPRFCQRLLHPGNLPIRKFTVSFFLIWYLQNALDKHNPHYSPYNIYLSNGNYISVHPDVTRSNRAFPIEEYGCNAIYKNTENMQIPLIKHEISLGKQESMEEKFKTVLPWLYKKEKEEETLKLSIFCYYNLYQQIEF